MADKLQAAASIRNFANLYKQMGDAADALEAIGSIEQATAEANQALLSKRSELEEVTAQIADITSQRSEAEAQARQTLNDAKAIAEGTVAAANAEAEGVASAAAAQAENVLLGAKDKATAIIQAAQDQAKVISDQTLIMRSELEACTGQLTDARRDLADTKAQLEKMRSDLRVLLG